DRVWRQQEPGAGAGCDLAGPGDGEDREHRRSIGGTVRVLIASILLAASIGAAAADDALRVKPPRGAGGTSAAQVPSSVDACALLSAADLQTVQGEPLREQKSSHHSSGALAIAQCFFVLPTYAKSVTLAVASGATGGAQD